MFLHTQVPERMGHACVSVCDVAGVGSNEERAEVYI